MDKVMVAVLRGMPPIERPAGLTDEMIRRYTRESQEHFRELLSINHPNIRRGECTRYLQIWDRVESLNYDWEKLDNLGRNELRDCFLEEHE
jgi:hypothetical protein